MSDHRDSILINSYITQTFNRIDERANAASRSTVIRPSLMPDIRQSSWLLPEHIKCAFLFGLLTSYSYFYTLL